MRIRKRQKEALRAARFDDFVARLAQDIRGRFEEELRELGVEDVPSFVRGAISRAERHRLATEDELQSFVEYAVVLGPRFDEEVEWARGELARDEPGSRRLERIDHRLLFGEGGPR